MGPWLQLFLRELRRRPCGHPARRPGFCKHILATLRYLTDDAEIQISKDLSAQQQEALKKDRAQFYKEAEIAYEKMPAPAAKGAEEIAPEEEPPPSPEFSKLPAPPKSEVKPRVTPDGVGFVARNMFCSTCPPILGQKPEEVKPAGPPQPQRTSMNLKLLAIMYAPRPANPKWSVAIREPISRCSGSSRPSR